uniref:CDH-cyt domain-containing protein n=1 Tax=Macrostomum lignano TaxID=282301 RepID=A0A1I8FJT0_9PLAT
TISPAQIRLNLVPQAGFFEAVKLSGGASESVRPAAGPLPGGHTGHIELVPTETDQPYTVMGNWSDISVSASVLVPSVNSTTGIFVAARIDQAAAVLSKPKASSCGCFRLATSMPSNQEDQRRQFFVYGYDAWVKLTLNLQSGKYNGKDWKPNCRELGDAAWQHAKHRFRRRRLPADVCLRDVC